MKSVRRVDVLASGCLGFRYHQRVSVSVEQSCFRLSVGRHGGHDARKHFRAVSHLSVGTELAPVVSRDGMRISVSAQFRSVHAKDVARPLIQSPLSLPVFHQVNLSTLRCLLVQVSRYLHSVAKTVKHKTHVVVAGAT